MEEYVWPITLGLVFGIVGRLLLLKTDYRQYPTQPHGSIIHISLSVIAAGLGSIAIPALWEGEYAAITFLALAAQQFREVRTMERETLTKMDDVELVSRGKVYIEGIAMVFEGRNYLVIFIAFVTSLGVHVWNIWVGVVMGLVALAIALYFKSGNKLSSIVRIEPGEVLIDGADIYVNDIHIMNIGLEESRDIIRKQAIGVVLHPHNVDSTITLANPGQRQAIVHDLAVGLGIYRDEDKPSLVPLTRRDLSDGRLGIFFIPQIRNMKHATHIISQVPLLENAVRIPSESDALKT